MSAPEQGQSPPDPAGAAPSVDAGPTPSDGAVHGRASIAMRIKALLVNAGLFVVTLGVGWLVWSVVEWWGGRNPSYRLTGLRVVRQSDGAPASFVRSAMRELGCIVLILPTLIACLFVSVGFAMGASPPDGVFNQARRAPWDALTRTDVVRAPVGRDPSPGDR